MQPSKSPAMVNGSRTYSVTRIQILLWSRWRLLPIGAWRVLSSSWLPSCSVFLLPVPMHRWRTRVSLAAMLSVLIKRSGTFHLHLILFFSSGKGSCRLLADKLTDYRSYQQLVGILTHREKIGDFGTEDIYAEVFGSASYDESESAFILTSSVSSEKYRGLFDGWNDKAERNYLLCTQVGCSERGDAERIINALISSVSNLAVSGEQISLGWETDTSAWFSSRPVPSLKRNSLFAELLYRIVYRDSLRIGICRNCGAPFLQSGIGSLNDVCSQACRMAQRRRKGLA